MKQHKKMGSMSQLGAATNLFKGIDTDDLEFIAWAALLSITKPDEKLNLRQL